MSIVVFKWAQQVQTEELLRGVAVELLNRVNEGSRWKDGASRAEAEAAVVGEGAGLYQCW